MKFLQNNLWGSHMSIQSSKKNAACPRRKWGGEGVFSLFPMGDFFCFPFGALFHFFRMVKSRKVVREYQYKPYFAAVLVILLKSKLLATIERVDRENPNGGMRFKFLAEPNNITV